MYRPCERSVSFRLLLAISVLSGCFGGQYDFEQTLPDRATMVHLFEWRWSDVAKECEDFLHHFGYGAVQVSPPNEHAVIIQQGNRPWWERYQPVSYRLHSRSGSEEEFVDMVQRCNKVGVRIIVDTVINHMTGAGLSGIGSGNCSFSGPNETFPCVPYNRSDFNDATCPSRSGDIESYSDAIQVRNCRLVSLLDLNAGMESVQAKIAAYLSRLVDIGVAGFRIDAAKHMWPADISTILSKVRNLNETIFGPNQRPFVAQEVIDKGGEAIKGDEYVINGRITNFKYGIHVSDAVRRDRQNFKYFSGFGASWEMWQGHDVLNFIDNHDNQRGHGGGGSVLTHKDPVNYVLAVSFMLAWPYGYPRVMSSFYFEDNGQGPPNKAFPNYSTAGPTFLPDLTCDDQSGFVCEHRWPAIRNMVKFRQITGAGSGAQPSDIVADEDHRVAFRLAKKGFYAINNAVLDWQRKFATGLTAGSYCDIIGGSLANGNCTGATVAVDFDGNALVKLAPKRALAIHSCSRIGSRCDRSARAPVPVLRPAVRPAPRHTRGWKRTVVFVKKQTVVGQNVFILGGIDHTRRKGCEGKPAKLNPCSIPIKHRAQIAAEHFLSYRQWSQNDDYLDWYAAEENQGKHKGLPAAGTPLVWSTNESNAVGFQRVNEFGPHYWMLDVLMDCSKTNRGLFEFKVYSSGWEADVLQNSTCNGYVSSDVANTGFVGLRTNHIARCGYMNVFESGSSACRIERLAGDNLEIDDGDSWESPSSETPKESPSTPSEYPKTAPQAEGSKTSAESRVATSKASRLYGLTDIFLATVFLCKSMIGLFWPIIIDYVV